MQNIVTISGSPSNTSRSSVVLDYTKRILVKQGFSVKSISVQSLSPEDLLFCNFESPALKELQILIEQASGIIISTPIYKASYTGVLKALLDLMPQYAFYEIALFPVL
jgi:FMN reductase